MDGAMDKRSLNAIRGRVASAPAILAPTVVLLVLLLLFSGMFPISLGPLRDRFSPNRDVVRQLLVVRSEPSATTGAPIGNVWMIRSDGTGLRRITNATAGIIDYTIDPKGSHIAYTTPDGPATTALWVADLNSGASARITPAGDPAAYANPVWSPAGDSILYVRRNPADEDSAPRIYAIHPDGQPLGQISGQGDGAGEAPVWSPDATHVALREVVPQLNKTTLVISDFTANPIKIPIGTSTRTAWSPDGQWLVYDELSAGGDGGSHLVLLRADGTQRTVLFPGETHIDTAPTWSPDGETLAFLRRTPGPPPHGAVAAMTEVWSTMRDGHDMRRLFGGDQRASSEPLWSPDGRLLASTRYRISDDSASERGVWVLNADGSRARQLLKDATNPLWLP
jgi:Tol biopolymer transport system component